MPIDPGVFEQSAMRAALARRDIGRVYALLVDAGVSQREIASRTGQTQSEVHAIVHGRPVKQYAVLERIAAGLGVDRGSMGLAYAGEQSTPAPPEEVDEDVKRRAFLAAVSAALWGRPVLGELLELPHRPDAPVALPSRLAAADVEAMEALTERLRALARQYGGQADTVGAVAARSTRLADVAATAPLRARLYSALAELHTLAGWCSFDSRADDQARRHFSRAVEFAGLGGDAYRRSGAMRHAGAMLDQGGHHDDALKLYQMAQVSLADARGDERAPALAAWLHMVSARALAHLDRPELARSELAAAREGWQPPNSFEQADMDHVAAKVQLRLGMLDSAEQFASTAARAWGGNARREGVLTAITRAGIHLRAGQASGPVLARQAGRPAPQAGRRDPPRDGPQPRRGHALRAAGAGNRHPVTALGRCHRRVADGGAAQQPRSRHALGRAGLGGALEPSDTFPTRQRVLHSLTLLAQQDLAPTAVLEQVTTELDRDGLDTAETDHYDTLVAQLHRRHGPGPPATV